MVGFESVGQILPRSLKNLGAADNLLALQVRKNFTDSLNLVFGGKKLPKIRAGKFNFGTLTVLVPDPAWSQVLREKEEQILKKLNTILGQKAVQKLQFRIAAK